MGDVTPITNGSYPSVSSVIQKYIDLGILPNINLIPLIPLMTSNTTPAGEAFGSSIYNAEFDYFNAFNENSNGWVSKTGNTGEYIVYDFAKQVFPRQIGIKYNEITSGTTRHVKIQASNDNDIYIDISEDLGVKGTNILFQLTSNQKYRYIKMIENANNGTNGKGYKVQIYGTD